MVWRSKKLFMLGPQLILKVLNNRRFGVKTFPKTNSLPLKTGRPRKERMIFQSSIFIVFHLLFVSGRIFLFKESRLGQTQGCQIHPKKTHTHTHKNHPSNHHLQESVPQPLPSRFPRFGSFFLRGGWNQDLIRRPSGGGEGWRWRRYPVSPCGERCFSWPGIFVVFSVPEMRSFWEPQGRWGSEKDMFGQIRRAYRNFWRAFPKAAASVTTHREMDALDLLSTHCNNRLAFTNMAFREFRPSLRSNWV